MSAQVAMESSAAAVVTRRQPLLTKTAVTSCTLNDNRFHAKNESTGGSWSRMGETTGECAAVCCCCPCAMMDLLILAVYRLPTGLWRKKKRKRLLTKRRKSSSEDRKNRRKSNSFGFYTDEEEEEEEESGEGEDYRGKNDAVEWDNEMWERFYGAGFWRSASQREDD
ncbi:hypothetical protein Pfo_017892 [Paulownia fortunei]|nr:hypothetical protein Pfo_017892 [Paulownia fortunei]